MNLIQQKMIQDFKDRGGKVVVFDRGASTAPMIHAMTIDRAERQLARMRRHGSRKVKVAVRRFGSLPPQEAVSAIRSAVRR